MAQALSLHIRFGEEARCRRLADRCDGKGGTRTLDPGIMSILTTNPSVSVHYESDTYLIGPQTFRHTRFSPRRPAPNTNRTAGTAAQQRQAQPPCRIDPVRPRTLLRMQRATSEFRRVGRSGTSWTRA